MNTNNEPSLEEIKLPALRKDLQINKGGVHHYSNSKYHLIFDPLTNQYFKVGQRIIELLKYWHLGNAQQVFDAVNQSSYRLISEEDLLHFIKFLYKNSLTQEPANQGTQYYLEQYQISKIKTLQQILKQYLFLRIPLINPQRFLKKTYPYIRWMYHRYWYQIVIVMAILGIYLVSREWVTFKQTFIDFLSIEGLFYYVITVVILKVFHELGHAYTSIRYGARVNSFGIFFMLFVPLLYSDVLETWKIHNRKKRINIAIAGIRAELIVGIICLFLWAFLPEGSLKNCAFFAATTSLVTTLLFNSNIFAKFDGYFILMDLVRIDNLQSRAMDMGQWYLRKILFNTPEPIPEQLPLIIQRRLFFYAIGVYLYRLLIFTSIALIFYTFFIKVIGVTLFIIEIATLIILPIIKEIAHWISMRKTYLKQPRSFITIGVVVIVLLLGFLPISSSVQAPALLQAQTAAFVYPKEAGKIEALFLQTNDYVDKGQTLLTLKNPQLELSQQTTQKKIAITEQRINNALLDNEQKQDLIINKQQKRKLEKELLNIQTDINELTIRSPLSGYIKDLTRNLHAGRWITTDRAIAYIIDPQSLELITYLKSSDINRIDIGNTGFFYTTSSNKKNAVTITNIQALGVKALSNPYFSSHFGGEITTEKNSKGQEIPLSPIYRVILKLDDKTFYKPNEIEQIVKGKLYIKCKKISLFKRFTDKATSIIIRESGF